jgi:hypothetical protein
MKVSSVGLQKESKVLVRDLEPLERWALRVWYSCEFLTSLSESLEPIVRSLAGRRWSSIRGSVWLVEIGVFCSLELTATTVRYDGG